MTPTRTVLLAVAVAATGLGFGCDTSDDTSSDDGGSQQGSVTSSMPDDTDMIGCQDGAAIWIEVDPPQWSSQSLGDTVLPLRPPSQGTVATDVELTIGGVSEEDIEGLRIELSDASGALANQYYRAGGLEITCRGDSLQTTSPLSVSIDESFELVSLDGVEAELTATLDLGGQEVSESFTFTLRVAG